MISLEIVWLIVYCIWTLQLFVIILFLNKFFLFTIYISTYKLIFNYGIKFTEINWIYFTIIFYMTLNF